jgi:hypothetical protein
LVNAATVDQDYEVADPFIRRNPRSSQRRARGVTSIRFIEIAVTSDLDAELKICVAGNTAPFQSRFNKQLSICVSDSSIQLAAALRRDGSSTQGAGGQRHSSLSLAHCPQRPLHS